MIRTPVSHSDFDSMIAAAVLFPGPSRMGVDYNDDRKETDEKGRFRDRT